MLRLARYKLNIKYCIYMCKKYLSTKDCKSNYLTLYNTLYTIAIYLLKWGFCFSI